MQTPTPCFCCHLPAGCVIRDIHLRTAADPFVSRSALLCQQSQDLMNILLAEGYFLIVYDEARDAHHMVALFQILKMKKKQK